MQLGPKPDTTPRDPAGDTEYYAYKVEWRPAGTYIIIVDGTYAECCTHAYMEAAHMHASAAATERGQDALGTAAMANLDKLRNSYPMEFAVDLYGYTVGVTRHRRIIGNY